MNSVVNFVVVKLINKPAVQQTLENTIFVDNKRAREQTNVLPKEIETVVFRKKIMKSKWEKHAHWTCISPFPSPRRSDRSSRKAQALASFSRQKQQVWHRAQTNKLAFYSGKLLKKQTKLLLNLENNADVDYYHYPIHFALIPVIAGSERQPCP